LNTRQFLKHRQPHAPAKPATAEETEFRSPSVQDRRSTAELFANALLSI